MTLRPRERHEASQAARVQQETADWKAEYARRAGIEGTLSEGIRGFGLRRLPLRRAGQGPSAACDHGGGDEPVAVGGLAGGGPSCEDPDFSVRAAGSGGVRAAEFAN